MAVFDQLVVSGTNFVSLVALGRAAQPESLAIYSLGFSVLVITSISIRSLVIIPFMVLGQRANEADREGMRNCVFAAWGMVLAAASLVLAALFAYGQFVAMDWNETLTFACLVALAIPSWLLRDIARHMSLAELQFERTLVIDVVAAILQLSAVATLFLTDGLSASSLMLALLASSLLVGLGWAVSVRKFIAIKREVIRDTWIKVWHFGRWGLVAQACHVVQGYAVHWIVVFTSGLHAAGVYAASASIVQLANPFIQGVGNALIPLLARRRSDSGVASLVQATTKITRLAWLAATFYVTVIWAFGTLVVNAVYGSEYEVSSTLLVLLASSLAIGGIILAATKVISVMEFPQLNCALSFGTATLTVLLAVLGGVSFGIQGAVAGLFAASCVGAVAKWMVYRTVTQY